MSILIADAGATSTTWAVLTNQKSLLVKTSGINPVLKVDPEIESILFDELIPQIDASSINRIYFYGAGCKDKQQKQRILKLLNTAFRNKDIEVKTDVEGAGLTMFGFNTGIVAISGTGSSAGLMEHGKLIDIMPSRAYPEGDYAAAAQIGAHILKDVYAGDAPISIEEIIVSNQKLRLDDLFLRFQNPNLSKMIAAKVLSDIAMSNHFVELKNGQYLTSVVNNSLDIFYNQLHQYFGEALLSNSLSFIGSTANTFKKIFTDYFLTKGIQIRDFQPSPIEGLIKFHISKT